MGKEDNWLGLACFTAALLASLWLAAFGLSAIHERAPAPFEEWVGEEDVGIYLNDDAGEDITLTGVPMDIIDMPYDDLIWHCSSASGRCEEIRVFVDCAQQCLDNQQEE